MKSDAWVRNSRQLSSEHMHQGFSSTKAFYLLLSWPYRPTHFHKKKKGNQKEKLLYRLTTCHPLPFSQVW